MNTVDHLDIIKDMQAEITDLRTALQDETARGERLMKVLRAVSRLSFVGGKSSVTALSQRLYRINDVAEDAIANEGGAS